MTTASVAPPRPDRSWWARTIHPWLLNRVMDTAETRDIRARVCAPLAGDVLEVGFGTGHNLPFLPDAVDRVLAVEPLERGVALAADRIAASSAEVELIGADARRLPLPDASVDTVLCTWSLCSIDDPLPAAREIARVLRPGGHLHVVEHGRSPEPGVARWQRRLDPLWSRVAAGCHLDRDLPPLLEGAGLCVESLDTYYTDSEPRLLGWTFEGRARRG
ncbi:MAG TPA: class I SAM-dependent methyltransferase [Egicoccus sp.]|nr:class I SAM-dependent methyltransferase [Egicoccus sp.]HSK24670.1 class I SAM-dependent methyltransferase [Egicoccus sp.]